MSDNADYASDLINEDMRRRINEVKAKRMANGYPGYCYLCGEYSSRLVQGACAPCRDRYKLP